MEMPLVTRELERHTHRKTTYGLRMVGGTLAFAYLGWFYAFNWFLPASPDTLGTGLLNVGKSLQFGASVFLPALLTAGLIANERQEGTLGLLLLASSKVRDVYFAKLLSSFVHAELVILSALPVLAIAAFFGGVSVGEAVLQTILFSVTALAVCSLGLLCSTLSRTTGAALFGTLGCMVFSVCAMLMASVGLHIRLGNWNSAIMGLTISEVNLRAVQCIPGVLAALAVAALCSWASIALLPRQAYERPAKKAWRGPWRRSHRKAAGLAKRPVAAILSRGAGGFSSGLRSPAVRVFASLGLIFLAFFTCVGALMLTALVAYDVASSLDKARRTGLLDDVRMTPAETLVKDLFRVQFIRSALYLPAFLFTGAMGMNIVIMMQVFYGIGRSLSFGTSESLAMTAALLLAILMAALQLSLVVAIACSQAQDGRTLWRQSFATVLHYLFLSFLWYMFCFIGVSTFVFPAFFRPGPVQSTPWHPYLILLGALAVSCLYFGLFTAYYYSRYRKIYEKYV